MYTGSRLSSSLSPLASNRPAFGTGAGSMSSPDNAPTLIEVVPNRLYWACTGTHPRNTTTHHYFSIDQELVYEPFCADFGPLNLSSTYRYSRLVE